MASSITAPLPGSFMSLSAEIRNKIYRFLLYSPWPLRLYESGRLYYGSHYAVINDADRPAIAIMYCCKTIYNEAIPVFYDINNLFLYRPTDLRSFAQESSFHRIKFNNIKHITLDHLVVNKTRLKELNKLQNLAKLTLCGSWTIMSLGDYHRGGAHYPADFITDASSDASDMDEFDQFLSSWVPPRTFSAILKDMMVARPKIDYELALDSGKRAPLPPDYRAPNSLDALGIFKISWKEETQRYSLALKSKTMGASYLKLCESHH